MFFYFNRGVKQIKEIPMRNIILTLAFVIVATGIAQARTETSTVTIEHKTGLFGRDKGTTVTGPHGGEVTVKR